PILYVSQMENRIPDPAIPGESDADGSNPIAHETPRRHEGKERSSSQTLFSVFSLRCANSVPLCPCGLVPLLLHFQLDVLEPHLERSAAVSLQADDAAAGELVVFEVAAEVAVDPDLHPAADGF